jgi:hypothetical protein
MEFSYQLMTEYLISSRDWLKKHFEWRKAASDAKVKLQKAAHAVDKVLLALA